jgi:hypothetical protein
MEILLRKNRSGHLRFPSLEGVARKLESLEGLVSKAAGERKPRIAFQLESERGGFCVARKRASS